MSTAPLSLYLHIPFCAVRCTYCAFTIVTRAEALIPAYVSALCREVTSLAQHERPLHSIYFGGGTPTRLTPDQIGMILHAVRESFAVTADAEITMEANPSDVSEAYLAACREHGVNRLSIGMQSAQPDELRLMARDHKAETTARAVDAARRAGFTNVNLDLIFALPRQTLENWAQTLTAALALAPDHLALYALELEDGTALTRRVNKGSLPTPDDDLAAAMYEMAQARTREAGFIHYEISNWARAGYESRHNRQYWTYGDYIGVGMGAHGFVNGIRYEVMGNLQLYLARMEANAPSRFPLSAAVASSTPIPYAEAMVEYLFTGLRLIQEGVDRAGFRARFGVPLESIYGEVLRRLSDQGLIEFDGQRLRLTPDAYFISNRVSAAFMP